MIRFLLAWMFLAAALCAPAQAENARQKLKAVESTLTQRQAQADALDRKTEAQSAELGAIKKQLISASQALAEKQEEQSRLQDKQDELADDIDAKAKALADEKRKLGSLVLALIELGRKPPETMLLQQGLTEDHIHRTIYLRSILPRVREEAESLGHDLVVLHDMRSRLSEQERLTAAATDNLNQQRQKLDQLMKARQGLLQKTETQKQEIQKQLVALTSQAQNLRELMEKVSPKENKRQPHSSAPPASLKWPVGGTQIRHFGEKDGDGVRSEGITFAALSGAPVVAPAAGKVVFAGPFKGYGPIVILQHQGGYHSFLAGFGRIDAEMGDEVDTGEPIGVMPVKTGSKPELYFEWRRGGEPIDPVLGKG